MSTTTKTEATIVHPAWCDPAECGTDPMGAHDVYHWSAKERWESPRPEVGDAVTACVRLCRADLADDEDQEPTVIFLDMTGGDMPIPVEQMETLGAWLTTTSAKVRQAIATEGGEGWAATWLEMHAGDTIQNHAHAVSRQLGKVVSDAIKDAGMSRQDITEATGIPRSTLSRRLTGRGPFYLNELDDIGRAIDVDVSALLKAAEDAAR